jgi:hypothetical protein
MAQYIPGNTATENTEDTEIEEKDELTEQILGAAMLAPTLQSRRVPLG